jgi:hypothetical protein
MFRQVRVAVSSTALALLCAAAFPNSALASDWYVDAASGNNASDGASPSSAWRTISHALAQLPPGSQRVFIAPGTYNLALGETFPIALAPGQQLIGAAGEPRPVVSGEGLSGATLFVLASSAAQPLQFGPDTRLEHLELRRAQRGVELVAQAGEVSPSLVDLRIERMTQYGVSIRGEGGLCQPQLRGLQVSNMQQNLDVFGVYALGSVAPGVVLDARECVFSAYNGAGAWLESTVDARFERCNFDGLGLGGVFVNAIGDHTARVACVDSAITFCLIPFSLRSVVANVSGSLVRCTVAANALPLAAQTPASGGSLSLNIDTSIVVTAGALLQSEGAPSVSAARSLISDGSFDGVNGCFSGPAGFRDEAGGDFRLRWGSPCIDAALSNAPSGALDLARQPRLLDGNLDRTGRTDLGAFEFQPLELSTSGALGSVFVLENWGPQNAQSLIYWARSGLAAPTATPFGVFGLDTHLARVFRVTSAGASAPTITQRLIPSDIALVGHTFSFQALTDSPAAPLLRAFTNAVEFTVVP